MCSNIQASAWRGAVVAQYRPAAMRLRRTALPFLFATGLACLPGARGAPAPVPGEDAGGPWISASPLGENQWALTLELPVLDADHGEMQQLLMPAAAKLCGDLVPRLDAFRQTSLLAPVASAGEKEEGEEVGNGETAREPPDDRVRLVQVVLCEPAPVAMPSPSRALTDAERTAMEDDIRGKTLAYFAGLDAGGDARASYAMLSEYLRSETFAAWRQERDEDRAEMGGVTERRVWRTTVYVDPPEAPTPGIYVAADYQAAYERALFECGYLMWRERSDGSFHVIRRESGHLPKDHAADMTNAQISAVREKMRCPGDEEAETGTPR